VRIEKAAASDAAETWPLLAAVVCPVGAGSEDQR
jgi:hypothetical protein